MLRPARWFGLLGLAFLVACAERTPFGPVYPDISAHREDEHDDRDEPQRIVAMTRNIYIGVNVDPVLAALATLNDPTDDVPAITAALQTLGRTAFPVRARALAGEIARTRPHVVGLQEVTELDINLPLLGVVFSMDYLEILQAALASRGLHYDVAANVTNTVAALSPIPGNSVTVIDHDVILVDRDRVEDVTGVVEENFEAMLPPFGPLQILRGWVQVDATIGERRVRFVNTHLEAGNAPGVPAIRQAQADELIESIGNDDVPVILLGDLNDVPGSDMHDLVTGAGFVDVWAALRPRAPGLTCCHADDLSNPRASDEFDQRIDYVMARGFEGRRGRLRGQVRIVGASPGDRVRGPQHRIWPSDHAGVVAKLRLTPAVTATALAP